MDCCWLYGTARFCNQTPSLARSHLISVWIVVGYTALQTFEGRVVARVTRSLIKYNTDIDFFVELCNLPDL
jgi:hypothetical protein